MLNLSLHKKTTYEWISSTIAVLLIGLLLASSLPLAVVHAQEPTDEAPVEETKETEEVENDSPVAPPEDGEDGADAPDGESETDGETVIVTGDAESGASVTNEVNENLTTTQSSEETDEETEEQTEADTLQPLPEEETEDEQESAADTVAIENTNNATTTTEVESVANTGDNTTIGGGNHIIETGNAVAYADVLNVVNTNITNSNGLVTFINDVLGYQSFDLRDEFADIFTTAESTVGCNLEVCGNNGVYYTVANTNNASITNNVNVVANTGGNQSHGGETAWAATGNAYASANIINVANTNITDSNYMLLVFNNFDDYAGNLVLPNSDFFDQMFNVTHPVGNVSVTNTNQANVANNVQVGANTGNNSAGNGGAIGTGNANAHANVDNMLNRNLFAGSSFSMLVRVHGDWDGEIFGLPDGMGWARTANGVRLYSTEAGGRERSYGPQVDSVSNTNTANITNNVSVYALTGENSIDAEDASQIVAGDAKADATVLNIANTNVVGSNWSNLVFNIYGNWSGNINFGHSNLWLGLRANSPDSPVMPGSPVTYTYTVFNPGDITATDVTIKSDFAPGAVNFDTHGSMRSHTSRQHVVSLGNIAPGETKEIALSGSFSGGIPNSPITAVPLAATVSANEPDTHPEDNTDNVIMHIGHDPIERKSENITFDAKMTIDKTADKRVAQPGDTVNYTVTIENHGGPLYDGILYDTLFDEDGNVVLEQSWPLDKVYNDEQIIVDYAVEFGAHMTEGHYTNVAQVLGYTGSRQIKYQKEYDSPIAAYQVTLGDSPQPEVLSESVSCPQYLTTYMKSGADNDSEEVRKLQLFLQSEVETNLVVTGEFDLLTELAVREFQLKYGDDVLEPWGMERDSGYVYYTTQKKINEIYCQNEYQFPLSSFQEMEIIAYRSAQDKRLATERTELPSEELSAAPVETNSPLGTGTATPLAHISLPNERAQHQTTTKEQSAASTYLDTFMGWLNKALQSTLSLSLSLR